MINYQDFLKHKLAGESFDEYSTRMSNVIQVPPQDYGTVELRNCGTHRQDLGVLEGSGVELSGTKRPVRKTSWSVKELFSTVFDEPEWIVEGLIPVGLTVLAGRPKAGKSWLALQLAGAVGSGGQFLSSTVPQFHVLYVALEDRADRLKKRLRMQCWDENVNVQFELRWPKLSNGGLEKLEKAISEKSYKLVIIDTLSRIEDFKQKEVEDSTNVLDKLQSLAFDYGCAVVVIDHHKKPSDSASAVIDDVLGSTGKTAVADTILGLYKAQGETRAQLKAVSRDQEYKDLTLDFAAEIGTWQLVGDTLEVASTAIQQSILEALKYKPMSQKDICEFTDIPKSSVSRNVRKMLDENKLKLESGLLSIK